MKNKIEKSGHIIEATCSYCNNIFHYLKYESSIKRKYCTGECFHKAHGENLKTQWKDQDYKEFRLKKMLSESNKIFKGRTYEEIYGYERANEIKEILSDAHIGQYPTKESRLKRSKSLKGHKHWGLIQHSVETKLKMSLSRKGYIHTEETKLKIGLKNKSSIKKLWEDPEYKENQVRKIIKGWKNTPTKPESKILNIIQTNMMPFYFNGSEGDIIIGGRVPDFVALYGYKKVIEVFGRLFHDPNFPRHLSTIPESKTYDKTIEHYKNHGYECLIIWEDQIEEELVIDQIKRFIGY